MAVSSCSQDLVIFQAPFPNQPVGQWGEILPPNTTQMCSNDVTQISTMISGKQQRMRIWQLPEREKEETMLMRIQGKVKFTSLPSQCRFFMDYVLAGLCSASTALFNQSFPGQKLLGRQNERKSCWSHVSLRSFLFPSLSSFRRQSSFSLFSNTHTQPSITEHIQFWENTCLNFLDFNQQDIKMLKSG